MSREIAFLCSSFPRYEGDGASVFLLGLAQALVQKDYRIHVIAPYDALVDPGWKPEGIVFHRFRYTVGAFRLAYGAGIVPNLRNNPFLFMLVPGFLLAMAWKTWRVTRRQRLEMLHAHWIIPAGVIATVLRRWHGLPTVVTAHGSDVFSLRSRFWTAMRNAILTRCDAWTANTVSTRDGLAAADLPPGQIIPMGIDCERFRAGDRDRGRGQLDSNTFLILFVGRLINLKGVDVLLRASSQLDRSRNTTLRIAGDGPERASLEQMTRELRVTDRVRFLGQLSYDRLPDIYAAADVFVAPSRDIPGVGREGQGTVILEAMAAGCCVIGSATGGIPSLIQHDRTGLLVPPGDVAALAKAVGELIAAPEKRRALAEAACALAEKDYDWSVIARQFGELYGRVTGQAAPVR